MFGLTGYWNPIRQLWVKPFIRRTVVDSSYTSSAAYISTTGGLDVNYYWKPNIRLDGSASYLAADYTPFSTGPSAPYQQYWTFSAGVMYLLSRHFYVGPVYQFVYGTSDQFGGDYDQNVIMVRLGARL